MDAYKKINPEINNLDYIQHGKGSRAILYNTVVVFLSNNLQPLRWNFWMGLLEKPNT